MTSEISEYKWVDTFQMFNLYPQLNFDLAESKFFENR